MNEKEQTKKLLQMIQEKKPDEKVEQVLVKFCARSGVSLNTCKKHYRRLIKLGKIKET